MRACPLCNNVQNLAFLWETKIIQCPTCSLGYLDQLPTTQELAAMYSAEFWKGTASYADYVAEKPGLQHNFARRIRTFRRFQGDQHERRLFEVGCAHGFFLDMARQHWDVRGIDISQEAITYARDVLKLHAEVGDFESHPPESGAYDVVAMWDTVEHLYDPFLAVQKSAEALAPGGILALTTGDIGAWLPRLQKARWRLIHPTHLYYFSRRSMLRLLESYGLEVVHFSHEASYRTLRQLARILTFGRTERNWRHRLLTQIEKLPGMNLTIPLNTFDLMFVIARKPPHAQSDAEGQAGQQISRRRGPPASRLPADRRAA